jgi:hypothetical protein
VTLEEAVELVAGRNPKQLAKPLAGDPLHAVGVDRERFQRSP